MYTVAFTGHRPERLGGFREQNPMRLACIELLRAKVAELKSTKGADACCVSGMALGIDQWAAEVCVEVGVPFIAAVPFKGQESRWPEPTQKHYHELLAKASEVVIVSPGPFAERKMHIRNKWMVDRCDQLIAFFDGKSKGGTYKTIEYARIIAKKPCANLYDLAYANAWRRT